MAARTTTKAGDWSDPTVWNGGVTVPQPGDTVTIGAGHAVTLDTDTDIGIDVSGVTALTINDALTIESGASLTLRGNVVQVYGVDVTGNGAGRITFDSSQATPGVFWTWYIGGTLILRGTSTDRFVVQSTTEGTSSRFGCSSGSVTKGFVDAEYADFIRIGDATHFAFNPKFNEAGILRLDHCRINRCGKVASVNVMDAVAFGADPGATFTIDDSVFVDSRDTAECIFMPSPSTNPTGDFHIANCDIDSYFTLYADSNNYINLSGNTYRAGYTAANHTAQPATAGPYGVTSLALTGPIGGLPDTDSDTFTWTLGGGTAISGTPTITPQTTGAGTFDPTSFSPAPSTLTGTFIYHPPTGTTDQIITLATTATMPVGSLPLMIVTEPIAYHAGTTAVGYTFSGPAVGVSDRPSTDFTLALPTGQSVLAEVTVTLSDDGAGGTFTPSFATLAANTDSATDMFTYTAPSAERTNRTIRVSSSLIDPPSLTYTASRSFAVALAKWEDLLYHESSSGGGGGSNYVALDGPPAPRGQIEFENHYDPILAYYHVRDYTENPYWDAAIAAAIYQYRDLWQRQTPWFLQWHLNTGGLARHHERTGNAISRDTIILMIMSNYALEGYNPRWCMDWSYSREAALALHARFEAERIGYTYVSDATYTTDLRDNVYDHLLQWYDPASSPFATGQLDNVDSTADRTSTNFVRCAACKCFMVGVSTRTLIHWWDIHREAGYPARIKAVLDWLWQYWLGEDYLAFYYWAQGIGLTPGRWDQDVLCRSAVYDTGEVGKYQPELNGMIAPAYAWYARYTTDPEEKAIFLQRFEDLFRGTSGSGGCYGTAGVIGGLLDTKYVTGKQYNQEHFWEEEGLAWYYQATNPWDAATTHSLEAPTLASGEANRPSGVIRVALPAQTSTSGPVTITFVDEIDSLPAGGTFIPSTIILTTDRPEGVVRYAPPESADGSTVTITCTNDGGLTPPTGFTYAVSGVAVFATGFSVTASGSPTTDNCWSHPFTIALDPPGSVPPRAADAQGGVILMHIYGTSNIYPGGQAVISAENPAHTFWVGPDVWTVGDPITITFDNSAGMTNPAGTVYQATTGQDPDAATTLTITAPLTTGSVGVPSDPFTVATPTGTWLDVGNIPLLPTDGGAGGTFDPPYWVHKGGEPEATATFTYTPALAGTRTISISIANDFGLTPPTPVSYEVSGSEPSMATTEKYVLGSQATLMTTELNGLLDTNLAVTSSAYNNTVGGGAGDGYTQCDIELYIASFQVGAPNINSGISVWFLETQDATNYEDGDASTTPARLPDVVFPVRTVSTAQRIIRRVALPPGNFKTLVKNDGTGRTLAASANTLKIRPITREGV